MESCKDCRFWDGSEADFEGETMPGNEGQLMAYGTCTKVPEVQEQALAAGYELRAYIDSEVRPHRPVELCTHASFGCVLFEPGKYEPQRTA